MSTDVRTRTTGTAIFLFFVALFVTAYSSRHPGLAQTGSAIAGEVQRPVQYIVVGSTTFVSDIWNHYIGLVGLRSDYEALSERVKALDQDKDKLLELEQENLRLRKLLDSVTQSSLEVMIARVSGWDHSNWIQAITVDKGMRDGVDIGMAVTTAEGIVGHVISVGLNNSKILLITDHSSGIDAIIQANRARGIVEGTGQRGLQWRFVLQEDEIKIGDRLVTSGMDGVFPAGLFIGRVSQIDSGESAIFKDVDVTPAVNFNKLEEVMIITGIKSSPIRKEESKRK